VAALATPAIGYHRHLIEQWTDHIHPERDGSPTDPCPDFCCARASRDEYGSGSHGYGQSNTRTPADVGFSASEQAFLNSVATVNGVHGYTSGPMFFDAIDDGAVSKQQQDRALVQRGYQLCTALDDGLDSSSARQRVLEPLNDYSTDNFDYCGEIFIGYATDHLCPEHSDKTGSV
jgi:Protein of unknown function (DUF732)